MVRRMAVILTTAMLLTGMGLQARAAGKGWIRVSLSGCEGRTDCGTVTLWQVAEPAGQDYTLGDAFGGGLIKGEDVYSPELAQWLAEAAGEGGLERRLDADGSADFSNLEEGLYLVVQTDPGEGGYIISPFLIPMPYGGQWEVQANPKTQKLLTESPRTGDHPAPLLAAMVMILSGMGIAACVEKLRRK